MINIEHKPYGYKLVYTGLASLERIKSWYKESERILQDSPDKFSVLIDMQKIEILPVECQEIMFAGQQLYKRMGMERSVVIVRDKLTAMQFKLIAQKTGIYEYERYIDGSFNQDWEQDALNWLLNAVEPAGEKEIA